MPGIGPTDVESFAFGLQVAFDETTEFVPLGGEIDWTVIPAAAAALTTTDGLDVEVGDKYLPMGTVLSRAANGKLTPTIGAGLSAAANGNVGILNNSVREKDVMSQFTGFIEGGRVNRNFIQFGVSIGGNVQPTQAELHAALPRLQFAG